MSVSSLGYIGIYTKDLSSWVKFGTNVLGMEDVSARINDGTGNLYLKMDDRPFRIIVTEKDIERFGFSGWECSTEDNLLAAVARLRDAGTDVAEANAEETALRRVTRLFRFADPSGNQHEIYWGTISDFRRLVSPVGVSKFVTGDMGLGHIVLPAPNFDATTSFFRENLGFGLSDFMNIKFTDDPNEPVKRLWFMHCNPRHHSLAFYEVDHPAGCIHCMVEVENFDEVGRCEDRRLQNGVSLSATLGRHANDHMISMYMNSPSGFAIEYGTDGMRVENWDEYSVFESTVPSFWGHAFQQPE